MGGLWIQSRAGASAGDDGDNGDVEAMTIVMAIVMMMIMVMVKDPLPLVGQWVGWGYKRQ